MAYLGEMVISADGTTTIVGGGNLAPTGSMADNPAGSFYPGAATIGPSGTPLPGADPGPCDGCPVRTVYKTVLREVRVPVPVEVPGPTQYVDRVVYVDQQTGQQSYSSETSPSGQLYNAPGFADIQNPVYNGIEQGDEGITPEGGIKTQAVGGSGLLWLALLAGGIFLMKR